MMPRLPRLSWPAAATARHCRWISTSSCREAERQRATLSRLWIPTGGIAATEGENGHEKLVRAGFLRQSQAGIFHMLPLGVRVQDKLEKLLDKHMQSLGASKLSLSTITTEDIWEKSGRLQKVSSELFHLHDRKDVPLLLSPTHEEEVTSIVASTLKSYKDLPIKLYQITRKYRDEIRPRHGLLRSREFIMKDLYSFDVSQKLAIEAYRQISGAYRAFFAELKLPIVVAEASSGDMGGNHSHEYHLPHSVGEDTVATCDSCGYAANDEVAGSRSPAPIDIGSALHRRSGVLRGITKDRKSLVNVWYYKAHNNITDADVNIHTIKSAVPDFDTTLTGDVHPLWQDTIEKAAKGFAPFPRMVHVVDMRLVPFFDSLSREVAAPHLEQTVVTEIEDGKGLNLSRLADGDGCPRCETGSLKIHKALELGHTFYLGTRYSEPFDARVALLKAPKEPIPIEMGCYGIGLSRLFGAIAEHLADEKGLNWPRAIAPFEVAVIPTSGIDEQTIEFYDRLSEGTVPGHNIDAVLDDRKRPFGWKMRDADVTGYPIIVILGKLWRESKTCEVQCRRLSVKENVPLDGIQGYIQSLLEKL